MSNHTLYIQNENDDKFEKEPNKGPLVNALLAGYYSGSVSVEGASARGAVMMNTSAASSIVTSASSIRGPVPVPATCPNGHLLDPTGKCLTKDCKYSKGNHGE